MADIHFIDGEKGGVGKSLFCRTLLHYWLANSALENPVLFDTDCSRKDVEIFYSSRLECGEAYFSDDREKLIAADSIFQTALFGKPVVVNLGAGVYSVITDWIQLNGLIELGKMAGDTKAMKNNPVFQTFLDSSQLKKERFDAPSMQLGEKVLTPVRFFKWFVSSGQSDSIEPFRQSLKELGKEIPHVLVKNQYLYDDEQWEVTLKEIQEEIKKYNVRVISIQKLLKVDLKSILDWQLTFEEAISSSDLNLMQRQRIYMFCNHAAEQISACFKELIATGKTRQAV